MRRSETMGADNCDCAIKITYEHRVGYDGDEWDIVGAEVTRHCNYYTLDDSDDPWDI